MRWPRFFKRSAPTDCGTEAEGIAATETPVDRPKIPQAVQSHPGHPIRLPPSFAAPELSSSVEPESTSPRRESIESPEVANESRRESTRVEEVSKDYRRESIDAATELPRRRPPTAASAQLQLDQRKEFALGVGYGAFQSTLSDVRDRIVRIQEVLERDVAREATLEELSNRLDTLSRVHREMADSAPPAMYREACQTLEAAELSTRLLQVLQVVRNRPVTTPADLASELGLKPNTCSQYLNTLVARGHVRKLAYGRYAPNVTESDR